MKPSIDHPKIKPTEIPEIRHLAEQIGKFLEYWGFKAVQGRIWCYLFLSRRPLNSRELAQLAEVSPTLITQSIQVLLDYQVIQSAGKGPNGILLFQANPNAAVAIVKVLEGREARLLQRIEDSAARFDLAPNSKARNQQKVFELDLERSHQLVQWVQLASALLSSGIQLMKGENG
jgi:DNA-binding transcriptional regulator GbsR (MarR family)